MEEVLAQRQEWMHPASRHLGHFAAKTPALVEVMVAKILSIHAIFLPALIFRREKRPDNSTCFAGGAGFQ